MIKTPKAITTIHPALTVLPCPKKESKCTYLKARTSLKISEQDN
jgi:hypothetical protein